MNFTYKLPQISYKLLQCCCCACMIVTAQLQKKAKHCSSSTLWVRLQCIKTFLELLKNIKVIKLNQWMLSVVWFGQNHRRFYQWGRRMTYNLGGKEFLKSLPYIKKQECPSSEIFLRIKPPPKKGEFFKFWYYATLKVSNIIVMVLESKSHSWASLFYLLGQL